MEGSACGAFLADVPLQQRLTAGAFAPVWVGTALKPSHDLLFRAAYAGRIDVLNELVREKKTKQVDLQATDASGRSAVHHATAGDALPALQWLFARVPQSEFDRADLRTWTPLLIAVCKGSAATVKWLVHEAHVDTTRLYPHHSTPCRGPTHSYAIHFAAIRRDRNAAAVLRVLLSSQKPACEVLQADLAGRIPLHYAAAREGNSEVLHLLLHPCAHKVARKEEKDPAPPGIPAETADKAALLQAVQAAVKMENSQREILEAASAKRLHEGMEKQEPPMEAPPAAASPGVSFRDHQSRTALHVAAMTGRATTVRLLLQRGADPALEDAFYLSPWHLAKNNKHTECAGLLQPPGLKTEPDPFKLISGVAARLSGSDQAIVSFICQSLNLALHDDLIGRCVLRLGVAKTLQLYDMLVRDAGGPGAQVDFKIRLAKTLQKELLEGVVDADDYYFVRCAEAEADRAARIAQRATATATAAAASAVPRRGRGSSGKGQPRDAPRSANGGGKFRVKSGNCPATGCWASRGRTGLRSSPIHAPARK